MTYKLHDSDPSFTEEPQISLFENYSSWKQPKAELHIETDKTEYFLSLLKQEFKKINITDKSINKELHEKKVIEYFRLKISTELKHNRESNNTFLFYDLFLWSGGIICRSRTSRFYTRDGPG